LKSAILVGLSIQEFEYMTPYEVSLYIEATLEKEEAELKERLSLVWLGEYYHRTKRLPKLQDELKKISSSKDDMTPEEMLEKVKNDIPTGKMIFRYDSLTPIPNDASRSLASLTKNPAYLK